MQSRKEDYEILLDKMCSAHDQEFYLEASWIAYSLLENRLKSALTQSSPTTGSNNSARPMLGDKIQEIRLRRSDPKDQNATGDKLLGAYFDSDLLDKLHNWKESRNELMHAMADGSKTFRELSKKIYLLSLNSQKLVKDTCNASRLLKKNRSKA